MFSRIWMTAVLALVVACSSSSGLVGAPQRVYAQTSSNLWAWGDNRCVQLGDGTTTDRLIPTQIGGITDLVSVDGGGSLHTTALKSDGSVWDWGDDSSTGKRTQFPTQVEGINGVTAIAAGTYHTLALKTDGTVWAWGAGWLGMLGNGTYDRSLVPVQVAGLTNIQDIDAGIGFSLASAKDGSVWAWGENDRGALGTEMWPRSNVPIKIDSLGDVVDVAAGAYGSYALKTDGSVWAWGWNRYGQTGITGGEYSPTPSRVPGVDHAVAIAAGLYDGLALKSDGTVWAWGATFGKPAQVSGLASIVDIAAGDHFAVAVDSEGAVWAWGSSNADGQLGSGSTSPSPRPIKVTGPSGFKFVAAGDSNSFALTAPARPRNVPRQVTAGSSSPPVSLPIPPAPPTSQAPAPGAKSVAYLYLSDSQYRDQYKGLLESGGYAVDTIPLAQLPSTDLSKYVALVVGSDTGSGYTWGDAATVASIVKARKPTIGIQFGGQALFGKLGLSIGGNHAWTASVSSIRAKDAAHAIFNTPRKINIPAGGEIPFGFSHSTWAEYGPGSGAAELLASQGNDVDHYPIARESNCLEWGFEIPPDLMSSDGRSLFLNLVNYAETLPPPEPGRLSVSGLTVSPASGQMANTWAISASVRNDGGLPDRFTIDLRINGSVDSTQTTYLMPRASQTISFSVVRSDPGDYVVDLNGAGGSFTVRPTATTRQPTANAGVPAASTGASAGAVEKPSRASNIPWLTVVLTAAGIIIVAALTFLIARTLRKNART